MTNDPKDKPKEIPMPVPSIGAEKPKTKEQTKGQAKIVHDSDQVESVPEGIETSISKTTPTNGQIDTGESPVISPIDSSVSPPVAKESSDINSSGAPTLPFDEGDLMSKQPTPPSNVPATTKTAIPAVTSGPTAMDLDRQISDNKTKNWLTNQGAGYKVQGKYRPDAASIQGAANKNNVSTEILRAIQTEDYAEVIVRTHLGSQYVDTVVHHCFKTSRQIKLLEMATKHPDTVTSFTSEGLPVFAQGATFIDSNGKKKDLMLTIMHTLLADIAFSIRDALTKASAAGQAKILNQEWQDDVEIECEAHEIDMVASLQDQ